LLILIVERKRNRALPGISPFLINNQQSTINKQTAARSFTY